MTIRHRKPNRWADCRYAGGITYSITIVVNNGGWWFGEVVNGNMVLNEYGRFAEQCAQEISRHFHYVILDCYMIMPNHIHLIVVIFDVGTAHALSLQHKTKTVDRKKLPLSNAIQGLKAAVSRHIRRSGHPDFKWQRSFHDHIIRDECELKTKRRYMKNNPRRWADNPNHAKVATWE